ncbi:MAG: hypothetical protein JSS81_05860 [Acidobacteria bacterium]|nr:hypothetical protein [Acidobacteriota bacterium]
MSHGLKGKVKEMVTRMDAQRQAGFDTNLRSFMADNYSDVNNQPLTPEHLFAELEINPQRTQLQEIMRDDDTRYLAAEVVLQGVRRGMGLAQREQLAALRERALASFGPITSEAAGGQRFVSPEVFLDPVNRGVVQSTFYPDLVVREETVSQPQVILPKIDLSDAKLMDGNEAATIEEGSISYSTKTVTLAKKARAIKQSYESIQFSSLSLVQLFMEDVGRILGHTLNGMAVDAIVNGDQADLSENAAVIGVEATANKITWYDIARVAIQFGLIGRTGLQVIGNATTALDYLNLPEVKNKQFPGAPLLATMMKSPLTMPEELYVSTKVGANKIVIQDPSTSLVQLTAQPLLIETEKIIMKQIQGTAISIYTGFAKLQRNASIVIDGSILFSGNGFPTWMQPFAG